MRQMCLALMCGFLLVVPGLALADEGMTEGSAPGAPGSADGLRNGLRPP